MVFGKDTLWTVRLLCRPGVPLDIVLRDNATSCKLDSHSHQARYSDGEVFRKVRRLWNEGNLPEARKWTDGLSVQKRINIERIRENTNIHHSLDELIAFPGLLDGLPLGSFHKHLALHCDDEIVSYLQRIRDVWLSITCNHPGVVDIATVQLLEGRAPRLSESDRRAVKEAFYSNRAFTRVQDAHLRAEIRRTVLRFRGLIPSLKSFHENMKYISIGATIVLNLMYPGSAQGRSWKRVQTNGRNDRWTLRSMLRRSWTQPRHNLVETSEGLFVECIGSPSFKAAYAQIVLAALRNCSRLDTDTVSMFYQRAVLLGFQTPASKISGVSKQYIPLEDGMNANLRSMKDEMFLPQLAAIDTTGATSTHLVQKDFVLSFFGAYDDYRMGSKTVKIGRGPIDWIATNQDNVSKHTGEISNTHPNTPHQDYCISMATGVPTDICVQTLDAQRTVDVNRPPSVMSLSVAVHPSRDSGSVDEWLESSALRVTQSDFPGSPMSVHSFGERQVTRSRSQSRSGIDTPIQSWTDRLISLKENQFLVSPTTSRSRSPMNTSASNDYFLGEYRNTPAHRALQSLNFTFPREPALTSVSHSPTAISSEPVAVRPSAQAAPVPGPPLRPLTSFSTLSKGPSSDRFTSGPSTSSTVLSRSEIAQQDAYPSQAEPNWFHRHLPPLRSYIPQLNWVSEPRIQTGIKEPGNGVRNLDRPASPYSTVSLTPASDRSRSVIGTPEIHQQTDALIHQEGVRELREHHDKYWDSI
ncbi:hypothetical protein CT0861_07763 [Colletotrichum tofieldiae]|uniref:Uncharacterized protein n=1 Tax=Colletotrichum tofieldiae TaxID=708197 RepID=A0A161YEQ0_9PEZI|nr:hypothetical protein CT0861_07763 [Colletotrichum tofieldiae]